jgi:hypothetical protein
MTTQPGERIVISRVWLAGGAAFILSLLVNAILRALANAFFPISPLFQALAVWDTTIIFTFVGVFGATVVFAVLARLTRHAVKLFRGLAALLLVLSFIPNILMLTTNGPGATVPAVATLMVMHVTTAGITVWLLTTWPLVRR